MISYGTKHHKVILRLRVVALNKCSSCSVSVSVNRQFYSNRFTIMMLYVDDIPIFIYFDRLFLHIISTCTAVELFFFLNLSF